MNKKQPITVKLNEYTKPDYLLTKVDLVFLLDDEQTIVESKSVVKKNTQRNQDLVLFGINLELLEVKINDKAYNDYKVNEEELTLKYHPMFDQEFTLDIKTKINPLANKTCEGLYKSGNVFSTQMESQGFRRVTYFVDRPDNMAIYTTTIIADAKLYPVMLSNGNEIQAGVYEKDSNKHWIKWHDPFPKPSYLFALVAGDLGLVKDTFTTCSGRKIDLHLFCDKGNENRCHHALESLKKSMSWDEKVYGREYDLDIFMIVAVDSFNFGAMENKGLNIFNSSCVLANSDTTTDDEFRRIEGIVAHEYFHNWTGNRVTLRDWFQLTLKEGLTVFRDQEFSADMNSRAVQRINDVHYMYSIQFPEDAGPNAHPIRPSEYIEISNFYTPTIYHKGAEVIRMIHTLVGDVGFRKGTDLYFSLYDGQAITTEEFLSSMEKANDIDLAQFRKWYTQKGTPTVSFSSQFDLATKILTLDVNQKDNFHMPLIVGFLGNDVKKDHLIELKEKHQTFTFKLPSYDKAPLISFNRNFSSCIRVDNHYSIEELCEILANDTNSYVRWQSSTILGLELIKMDKIPQETFSKYLNSYANILNEINPKADLSFISTLLSLPDESILADNIRPINFESNHKKRRSLLAQISKTHHNKLIEIYQQFYKKEQTSMGERDLMNSILSLLAKDEDNTNHELIKGFALNQVMNNKIMTNIWSGLLILANLKKENSEFPKALEFFYKKYHKDSLVMTKYFTANAIRPSKSILQTISVVEKDPHYNENIPNHVRAIWRTFTGNYTVFHDISGLGYELLAERILYFNNRNPLLASGLAQGFTRYPLMNQDSQKVMKKTIDRMLTTNNLSKNVYEILNKITNN